jgi:chromosome segregation ATPase
VEQLRAELKETRQQHRDELTGVRRDARDEREQLRAARLAQLADAMQAAAERVDALTAALRAAEQVSEALRRQLGDDAEQGAGESTGAPSRRASRTARGT